MGSVEELTNNTNNTSNEDDGRRHSVGTSSGGDQSVATPKQSILLARSTHKSVMIIDGGGGQPKEKPKTDGDGLYEEEVVYEARKTQTDMAREAVSKQLISLLEEDSKEFTELDIKEMMPATPFSDVSFLKLRHFFDTVIQDLNTANKVGVPLDEVKEEFYFIWDGILKAHTNMKDLLQKDVTLSVEVADTMAKTRNLIKIAEDHPEITARLGSRLETAWNLVDVSEEEEKKNAARIEELKTDIMILNRNIQAAANMEGQNELTELMKIRRKLQDERDVLLKDMGRMRTSLSLLQERKSRLGEKRVEYLEAIKYADEEAAAQTEALQRETARKHSMEKEIERLIHSIEKKTKELNDIEKYYSSAKIKLLDLERGVSTQKVINEGALKDAETAFAKLDKLKHDFEAQVELVERLAVETFKKQSDLKDKEDEIIKIKAEGMQAVRQRNTNMKRCAVLQERLDALEAIEKP
ncbi:Cilia- and flagella-associated protein 58 [Orchesella cincta]|uniref:Cilia-and flagella-associated protein 58 n=1 Tax=Orchesella cincta TaxID=48709 RepID=A0A1D2NKU5_ORCCI|nr:Cilia- and flagella-associated protein 58 [Orchesella cincta]